MTRKEELIKLNWAEYAKQLYRKSQHRFRTPKDIEILVSRLSDEEWYQKNILDLKQMND